MRTVQVMLVEDDLNTLKSIRSYLKEKPDIAICGVARNGKEALEMLPVVHPDFVVSDLVMPIMDGFGLLEQMQGMNAYTRTKVIILSGLTRDSFVVRAMELGAYYYMCKPCDLGLLYRRIVEREQFDRDSFLPGCAAKEACPSAEIDALLDTQGISNAIRGYDYLHTAIKLGLTFDGLSGKITKELYPAIARAHGTTIEKVERAIRHAIQRGWERGNLKKTGFELPHRPSNGEYIARMVKMVSAQNGGTRRVVN